MANLLLKRIKDWATSITSFRTGDVIPVDGPDGTAKMTKDNLLKVTAQNTLIDNFAPAFDSTRTSEDAYKAGESVVYNGILYMFKVPHYGAWSDNDVTIDPRLKSVLTTNHTASRLLGNRLNDKDFSAPGIVYDASSALVNNSTNDIGTSGFCPCVPYERLSIYIEGSQTPHKFPSRVLFFDKDKKHIGTSPNSITSDDYGIATVHANAFYFAINIPYVDGKPVKMSVTNFFCDYFIPYSSDVEDVHRFVSENSDPDNILDPSTVTTGGYIDDNGDWVSDANCSETDYIDVSGDKRLFIYNSLIPTLLHRWGWNKVAQYDENKNFLRVRTPGGKYPEIAFISSDAKFVRISLYKNQPAEKTSIGHHPFSRFVPYAGNTSHVRVCDIAQEIGDSTEKPISQKAVTNALSSITMSGIQWNGKKWYAYGTSITDTSQLGKYAPYLAQLSGMQLTDKGISGGGIGNIGAHSHGQVFNAICNTTDGKLNADLITLETGPNDTDASVPLGTIYDTTQNTLAGCLNLCIRYLQANTNAQIAIMPSVATTTEPTETNQYYKWQLMIRDICIINRVFFIEPACNLGYGKLTGPNGSLYVVDNIHQTNLGGYILAEAMWEQIKRIPNFRTALPA